MPAEPQSRIETRADFGLVGDYRSGHNPNRQVTLIDEAVVADVAETLGRPVPPGASRRQIMVRGLDLNSLLGKTLKIGPVTLSGERPCDPCDNMERTIGPGAKAALEGRGGLCCHVVSGGVIQIGDWVEVD
jgi:MOSC domain-containing protein YiiM